MSGPLIIVVTAIYSWIAFEQYTKGNIPVAIMYAGYAFSNIGMFMVTK
jgi:hypothetical protein